MFTILPVLVLPGIAQASELPLKWGDVGAARYHLESAILTPRGFRVYGQTNIDARIVALNLSMDTTCAAAEQGRGWLLTCDVDEIGLSGEAMAGEAEKLAQILSEFETVLLEASVQIQMRSDGHIKAVDLEGPSKENRRYAYIHEQMRQFMRRAYSPLSVVLPKGGEDPGKEWKVRGMHVGFELMSTYGTAGGTRFDYKVEEWNGTEAFVSGVGRGSVGTNLEMEAGSGSDADGNIYGSSTNPSVAMIVAGQARYDAAKGMVAYSELAANGQTTAQSLNVGNNLAYQYEGWAGRINEDGTIERLDGPVGPAAD